jgi:hypothetical protein
MFSNFPINHVIRARSLAASTNPRLSLFSALAGADRIVLKAELDIVGFIRRFRPSLGFPL